MAFFRPVYSKLLVRQNGGAAAGNYALFGGVSGEVIVVRDVRIWLGAQAGDPVVRVGFAGIFGGAVGQPVAICQGTALQETMGGGEMRQVVDDDAIFFSTTITGAGAGQYSVVISGYVLSATP